MDRKALTRAEAAEVYGVSLSTIKRAVASGALCAKKNGRRFLISVADLDEWFAGLPDA